MRVVIIGAGNVATVLGHLIKKNKHEIIQVVSRSNDNARVLGTALHCDFTTDTTLINTGADLYLIAVTDNAMAELDEHLKLGDKLVLHTAGAVAMEVLENISTNYGVIYPLQSLRKENWNLLQDIPFLIDANTSQGFTALQTFAGTLSNNITKADNALRLKLHVAAVLVSNFTNHLYALAAEFCTMEGADFKLLQPLIEETATRLKYHHPAEMRTGPAVRKDIKTLQKHLNILTSYPIIHKIYIKMTDSIIACVDKIK